jgi:hypothetical protein
VGPAEPLPRYRPSGRYHPRLWRFALLVLGFNCALMAGYQWLHAWVDNVVLQCLLVGVAAMAVGMAMDVVLNLGKCRNRRLALGLAVALALGPLATSYVWAWRFARQQASSAALREAFTLPRWFACRQSSLCMEAVTGASRWSGSLFGFAWAAEALLFVSSARWFARSRVEDPYCEGCGRWIESKSFRVDGVGREEARNRLRRGELSGLVALDGTSEVENYTLLYTCAPCAGCERTYLSVREERRVTEGKARKKVLTVVLELSELPAPQGQELRERLQTELGQAA